MICEPPSRVAVAPPARDPQGADVRRSAASDRAEARRCSRSSAPADTAPTAPHCRSVIRPARQAAVAIDARLNPLNGQFGVIGYWRSRSAWATSTTLLPDTSNSGRTALVVAHVNVGVLHRGVADCPARPRSGHLAIKGAGVPRAAATDLQHRSRQSLQHWAAALQARIADPEALRRPRQRICSGRIRHRALARSALTLRAEAVRVYWLASRSTRRSQSATAATSCAATTSRYSGLRRLCRYAASCGLPERSPTRSAHGS